MKNIKYLVYIMLLGVVVFYMFTYICNVYVYKEITYNNIIYNEKFRAFDINEEEYTTILNKHVKGVGNSNLHKDILGSKRVKYLKRDVKKYIYRKVLNEIINMKKYDKLGSVYRKITYSMYCDCSMKKIVDKICIRQFNIESKINKILDCVYDNAKYFPVVQLESNKGDYLFSNTWMGERNYGGNRKHEGTDIMYTENIADVVPIVSISNGVVEKKGWLELGGYRLLVRTDNKIKFYYAHLSSYAKGVEEGNRIKAGQIIGYMGNTGYGKEGTKDKFDVHLHLGMYYEDKGKEIGINPYFLLKMLNFSKLYYK